MTSPGASCEADKSSSPLIGLFCFVLPVSLVSRVSVPLILNWKTKPEGPELRACGERPAGSRSAAPSQATESGCRWRTSDPEGPERPHGKSEAIAACYTVSQRPHQEFRFLLSDPTAGPESHQAVPVRVWGDTEASDMGPLLPGLTGSEELRHAPQSQCHVIESDHDSEGRGHPGGRSTCLRGGTQGDFLEEGAFWLALKGEES